MDNSSLCGTSVSERENTGAMCSSSASLGDQSTIDKLSTGLSGKLKINDGNQSNIKINDWNQSNTVNDEQRLRVERYYIEEEEEEEEEEEDDDDFSEEALLAQMGYAKSEPKRECEEEEEKEQDLSEDSLLAQMGYLMNEPPKHKPITTRIADLILVSAFKGSREKEGKPAKQCRVSWASDVYDPPCTSAEHLALSKTERHKSEEKVKGVAGKNWQKGDGKGATAIEGRGGGGKGNKGGGNKGNAAGGKAAGKNKDKKQADKKTRKHGGAANKYSVHDEH